MGFLWCLWKAPEIHCTLIWLWRVEAEEGGGGGGGELASVKLLIHWFGDWDSKTKGINHIQKAKHTVLASDEGYKMKMALQKKKY